MFEGTLAQGKAAGQMFNVPCVFVVSKPIWMWFLNHFVWLRGRVLSSLIATSQGGAFIDVGIQTGTRSALQGRFMI